MDHLFKVPCQTANIPEVHLFSCTIRVPNGDTIAVISCCVPYRNEVLRVCVLELPEYNVIASVDPNEFSSIVLSEFCRRVAEYCASGPMVYVCCPVRPIDCDLFAIQRRSRVYPTRSA